MSSRCTLFIICLIGHLFINTYPLEAQNEESVVRFGHISVEDPAVTLNKYRLLLDIISQEIGKKVILVQKPSYSKMNNAFTDREVDMGILNAFSYVQIAEKADLIPIAGRVIRNSGSFN